MHVEINKMKILNSFNPVKPSYSQNKSEICFGSSKKTKIITDVLMQPKIFSDILTLKKIVEVKEASFHNGNLKKALKVLKRLEKPLLNAKLPEFSKGNEYFTKQEAERFSYFTSDNKIIPSITERTDKNLVAIILQKVLKTDFDWLPTDYEKNDLFFYNYLPKVVANINALQKLYKIEDDAQVKLVGSMIKQNHNLN